VLADPGSCVGWTLAPAAADEGQMAHQGLLALQQWWQALYNNMCVSLLGAQLAGRAAEGWRMLTVHRIQLCSESTCGVLWHKIYMHHCACQRQPASQPAWAQPAEVE
jgi:hypothetical protein